MSKPPTPAAKRNPFAEVWDGMTSLAKRVVALEKRLSDMEKERPAK